MSATPSHTVLKVIGYKRFDHSLYWRVESGRLTKAQAEAVVNAHDQAVKALEAVVETYFGTHPLHLEAIEQAKAALQALRGME